MPPELPDTLPSLYVPSLDGKVVPTRKKSPPRDGEAHDGQRVACARIQGLSRFLSWVCRRPRHAGVKDSRIESLFILGLSATKAQRN